MRTLKHMLMLLLLVSTNWAIDSEGLLRSGNQCYEQGDYPQAVEEYEKILRGDMESAVLHYNLGCAYFNLEKYGKAILHFEKASQLSPRDDDIAHNLRYAKLFLKDRFDIPEPMPLVQWIRDMWYGLSIYELKRLELIVLTLLVLVIILHQFVLRDRGIRTLQPVLISLSVIFILVGGWLWNRVLDGKEQTAILLVSQAEISSAPVSGSSTLFVIHEGTSGKILNTTDSWYEIRLPDGKTGWIPHEAVGTY
ncbi:MAG: tetratricopeptide repeat protein [Candidatus Marinimicrobia bacterium]|nr:tetratricopeptide repeat protein [Candidatus Neomarinimicrobiota bacterium]MCF7850687.1 tetratricopeptide repeat protein [Candidatus Neomarinimicrobiota bacterium]